MRKPIYLLLIYLLILVPNLLMAQVSTKYYFMGFTNYLDATGTPKSASYLTVELYTEDSDKPVAVTLTSEVGMMNFEGVPIDIYKNHLFKVYSGKHLIGTYIFYGFTEKPSFRGGNITCNIRVDSVTCEYSTEDLVIDKSQKRLSIRKYISSLKNIEIEGEEIFNSNTDGALRLFLNDVSLSGDNTKMVINQVRMSMINKVKLVTFKNPNKYFSGAILFQIDSKHKTAMNENVSFSFIPKYEPNSK